MINIAMMRVAHTRFDRAFQNAVKDAVQNHNLAALGEARQELQQHVRSGRLLASSRGRLFFSKSRAVSRGEIGKGVKYAEGFEYGTRPHPIYPKRAKLLRFIGRRDGAVVYAKKVNHPGNRAFFVVGGAWWKMAVRYATVLRVNMQFLAQTEFR